MELRLCRKCHKDLPIEDFYVQGKGRRATCKTCFKKITAEHQKERRLKAKREYIKGHAVVSSYYKNKETGDKREEFYNWNGDALYC